MYNLNDISDSDSPDSGVFPKGIVAGKYYVFQGQID